MNGLGSRGRRTECPCGLTNNRTVPDNLKCGHEQFARRLRHCIGPCASPVRDTGDGCSPSTWFRVRIGRYRSNRHGGQATDRRSATAGRHWVPSIRNFAETHGVSRFTVVEAYDRLVAMGCLQSRRGAGFYVAARVPTAPFRALRRCTSTTSNWSGSSAASWRRETIRRLRAVRGCPIPGRTNPASARPSARSGARTARISSSMATLSATCHCANTSR